MTPTEFQNIPQTLREQDHWVCWRIVERDGDPTKIPIDAQSGGNAKSNDKDTWTDFQTAVDYYQDGNADGIGFMFAANGTVAGIDLDKMRDAETGQVDEQAKDIINTLDSYTEVSPSGTGYHVYVHGFVPSGGNRKGNVELYDSTRFFTVTGDHVDGTPETVEQRAQALREVHQQYVAEEEQGESENEQEKVGDVNLNEEEILQKAKNASNGDKFERLWNGDYSDYPSQSEADLALAGYLAFWTGGNRNEIDALFRKSRLYRDKWDEDRGGETYGERTIEKAIDGRTEFYDPEKATEQAPTLDIVAEKDTKEEREEQDDSAEYGDQDLQEDIIDIITKANNNDIQVKTARHKIARVLGRRFHFVMPEREVRGWRETLYVYNDDEGIYEPRGKTVIEHTLEQMGGDFVTNQRVNEIYNKVKRASKERGEQFKTPPNRLVVGNGVLDLHTGTLEEYSPYEYHRTKIDINWNPNAGQPDRVDDFLHEIVADKDVSTLYRLIAHTLYKEYVTEKAAMLIGGGQNGKSVFLDFVQRFLSDENVAHRALQDFEEQFATNQLQGKLANIHPDMGDHAVKDLSTFKKLTGRDQFTADVKYESPITFENYATLLFAANEMPVFGEDNHAVWRRWVYVEFPYEFREDKRDAKNPRPKKKLMEELTAQEELEALLLKAQQEIERWYNGDSWFADAMPPAAVREKMKKAAEPVYAFAATCLEADDESYLPKSVVREAYQAYAEAEDLPRLPENEFGRRINELRDFRITSTQKRHNKSRVNVYDGIKLSSRGRQLVDADNPEDGQAQMEEREPPRQVVMDQLEAMVEENDGDPVPKTGVVWSVVSNNIAKGRAEHELTKLIEQGDVMETDAGVIST